ncbi:hypothetical protein A3F66_02540 [candidate division TM6 bacterium RIFCSPHIGHO2_12_FULL_32_22]|nr:MAG: hypothetical protein A3F66_02540 [candidate division TM6 bacterium RIFCSPHIGHO2_12_FULL_32_22]
MKKILIILLFLPLVGAELNESNKRSFDEMIGCELDDIDLNAQSLNGPSFQDLLGIYNEDTAGPAYVNKDDFDEFAPAFWGNTLQIEFGMVQAAKKLKQKEKKPCCMCGKMLFRLSAHMRTHTGERPFNCYVCDRGFLTKSHLEQHITTHTYEKPFKCGFEGCEYAAARRSTLECHERTHTGETPYKCSFEGCNYAATHKSTLKKHIKRRHN